ncbi:MAG: SGNH/GDSL hydrolase family protein [Oscillospiraceae bacterium]|nr:SGNH/GDSL hydrolase family protein [Oscillospiraceae bacterium]
MDKRLSWEQMMAPVWDTDTVWGESLLMVRDDAGKACAPLLYAPERILSVTNAMMTEEYEEGRDWVLENGCLCLTPDSRIFCFTQQELYPSEGAPGASFPMPGGNILFGEADFFHKRQIAVSYTVKDCDWPGVKPVCAKELLPRTWKALCEKRPLHLLAYGDSITWGGNASMRSNAQPFQPPYGELFAEWLNRMWKSPVRFTNTAVGGRDSIWGVENTELMVNDYAPDLVLLAFGMNDGSKTPQEFESYTRRTVERIRAALPECEFILVATSTPNPILTDEKAPFWGNQCRFRPVLDAIAADPAYGGGIAVADITGMQAALHSRKRFIDTTGNHVNHPNDFFHRLYAQFLCGMLSPEA